MKVEDGRAVKTQGGWAAKGRGGHTKAESKRRKSERPREIVDAAFEEFIDKGFAAARLEDVAMRAGVSKGLPYLYFKTKEELFKAVLKTFVKPGFDRLIKRIHASDMSSEDFLRGPFLSFMSQFARSRRVLVVRLMISEGYKYPELTRYYMEGVIEPGMAAIRLLIERGIERGEFRETRLSDFPQLLVAPFLMSVLWRILFERHRHLDTDAMLAAHIDLVLAAIKTDAGVRA